MSYGICSPDIVKLFQHEKDSKLISDLMNHELTDQIFEWMEKEHIEDIYRMIYQASCICLTEENAPDIVNMTERASALFGLTEVPEIYLYRNYEKTVQICGLNRPFILISSDFLEALLQEEPEMLFGIIAGQAAGIRAGHNRGAMLFWALTTVTQYLPVPGIVLKGIDAVLNDWNRCRFFTYDRAFLLATGNYPSALRSLLLPMLPKEILDRFALGMPEDGYRKQAERFRQDSSLDSVLKMIHSMENDDPWIPDRYRELQVFYKNRLGQEGGYAE